MGSRYCERCAHKKDWFLNEIETCGGKFEYTSPFQNIEDAETGEKQVFISKNHPCYGCKYIFEGDNYEEGLKKCPFCGSDASLYSHDRGDNPGEDYSVGCNNYKCGIETALYETRKEAIEAWNRRVK